ncbi:MAG TPA: GNAT family N-acetyltransferase [Dongiaceae bacterium]|nr:GNAT family N-acetyltransferase [Dongiaceae bacterium]
MSAEAITGQVIIRPLAAADYDGWKPLWDGYNAFYGRVGPTALAADVTAMTWARLLDPTQQMHALVAECDGYLVGLTHYLYHLATSQIALSCYLSDLFTIDRMRGQGVGRKLIEAVYRQAQAAGAGRVYWMTHETNATAMRLYDQLAEKSGFLVYRRMF